LEAYEKIEYPAGGFEADTHLPGKKPWHDNRTDTRRARGEKGSSGEALNLWQQDYEVLIPFYGPRETIPYISAKTIINGTAPADALADALADKVVFVGMTSTGLGDDRPTPVSALDLPVPGVEVHANIYSALIDGRLKTTINPHLNIVLALLLFPLMLVVYSRARPQWGFSVVPLCAQLVCTNVCQHPDVC